jgi:hypothetical protein
MKPLTAPAALLSMLLASTLAHTDDAAGKRVSAFTIEPAWSLDAAYADFGRSDDTARVTGSNDIYRAKIHDIGDATGDARAGDPIDPIDLFGQSGYHLYDLDAWTMVSSGPIIGPYRNRAYSLFGSGLDNPALNALTMRSEYLRSNLRTASGSGASWSYPEWRF